MELYEAIAKRRTAREWEKRDVPDGLITKLIAAGIAAPSNNHLRDWEFIVLHTDEEKEEALQFAKAWAEAHGATEAEMKLSHE